MGEKGASMVEANIQDIATAKAEAVKKMTGVEPFRVYVPELMEIVMRAGDTWIVEKESSEGPYAQ